MTARVEERVRSALRGVRDADVTIVPSFEAVLARGRPRTALRPNWPVLAGAVATLVIAVGAIQRATRPEPLVVPAEVLALASWTPPTEALLAGARSHVEMKAPRFGVSLLDTLNGENR